MPTSMERSFVRCVPLTIGLSYRWLASLAAVVAVSERQLTISVRRDSFAALAELGVAAAVAHDSADLLPLDVAVDAGHPRVDLGEQQALARRNDVVGPGSGTRRGGLDTIEAAVAREADQPGYPIGTVFRGARKVAEPGMRAHHHQHIGEVVHQNAEEGLRAVLPFFLQQHPIDAPDIDAVETAGDRIEAGRVNDDVEFVLGVAGLDAGRSDALDRRLGDVDQLDVGLVVDLEVAAFERYPAGAEAVVFRDQLFGDRRVLDAPADLAGDEIRDQRVGLAVNQDIAEIAHPDAETGLAVELLPERLAFLLCHLEGGARVGRMDEAAVGLLATCEDLGIVGPDPAHLLLADLGVVQGRAPLGGALEHGQMADGLGHFRDGLHTSGTRADHRDALAV